MKQEDRGLTIQETTYSNNDIALFLDKQYPNAATCWRQDSVNADERIEVSIVEHWFKGYFPSNVNQMAFRQMQAACVAHMYIS